MTAEAPATTIPAGTSSLVSSTRLKGGRTGGTAAFSSDGSKVLAPRLNGWARIWCTRTGKLLRSIEIPETAVASSFSACGRFHSLVFETSATIRRFGRRTSQMTVRLTFRPGAPYRDVRSLWRTACRAGIGSDGLFSSGALVVGPGTDWRSSRLREGMLCLDEVTTGRRHQCVLTPRRVALLAPANVSVQLATGNILIVRGNVISCLNRDNAALVWSTVLESDVTCVRIGKLGITCLLSDLTAVLVDPDRGSITAFVSCGHDVVPLTAALSADGTSAAWACPDGMLRVWTGAEGEARLNHRLTIEDINRLEFIGPAHVLSTNGIRTVVQDALSGETLWEGEGEYLGSDHQGSHLLIRMTASEPVLVIVALGSGSVIRTEFSECRVCLFSDDGTILWLVTSNQKKLTLTRVRTESGQVKSRVEVPRSSVSKAVVSLVRVANADWPAVSMRSHPSISTVADKVYLARSELIQVGKITGSVALPERTWRWKRFTTVSVSADGRYAVTSRSGDRSWRNQLLEVADGEGLAKLNDSEFVQYHWSKDAKTLFGVDPDGLVSIIRDGKETKGSRIALSGSTNHRLTGYHQTKGAMVEASGQTLLIRPDGSVSDVPGTYPDQFAGRPFSNTGRYIWRLDSAGRVSLIEAGNMSIAMVLEARPGFVLSQLAFSQDDSFLAVLSSGGEIALFNLSDGSVIGRAYRECGGADAMFVSRDGSWVHLLQDDEVEAWYLGDPNDDATTAGKPVLRQNGIPASDKADLAALLGLDFDLALRDLEAGRAYRSFDIPKKSGGKRRIEAPRGPLHALQKELSVRLQSVHEPEPGSHGFVEGRSIVSNAGFHLGRRWVLNVDLKDFFPSVTEARVRGLFRAPPFDLGDEAAATLARLCCRNGGLPQGAPTSPVLANFAARQLDLELQAIASKYDLAVTRYADDITLSSDAERFPREIALRLGGGETEILTIVGPVLEDAITRSGFAINTAKTRLQYRSERQVVTGLVVNARLSPMRGHIKLVRALIHAWESKGLAAAAEDYFTRHPARLGRGRAAHKIEDFRSTVYGHMSFLHMVRGKTDRQFIAFCRRLSRIDGKNPPVFVREALQQEDGLAGITQ